MRQAITATTAGELAPELVGRPDLQRYASGALTVENCILHTTGMWTRRFGFELLGFLKDETVSAPLVPFIYGDEATYHIEFGAGHFRFWSDGGLVESAPGVAYELANTLSEGELEEGLVCFQNGPALLVLRAAGIWALTRSAHASWTWAQYTLTDGPYLRENADDSKTLQLGAQSGSTTLTASGHAPFVTTDVGRHYRLRDVRVDPDDEEQFEYRWGWVKATAYVSSTVLTVTVMGAGLENEDFWSTEPTASWRAGVFSDTTGWPRAGWIASQRLWLGGGLAALDGYFASRTGAEEVFSPGAEADDGMEFRAIDAQGQRIQHIRGSGGINILTSRTEHIVSGDAERAPITPTTIYTAKVGNYGSKREIPPVDVGDELLFADRYGRRVYGWSARGIDDLSVLASHIAGPWQSGGFTQLQWQRWPQGMAWLARGDGQGVTLNLSRAESVVAWARHIFGGDGFLERLSIVPGERWDEVVGVFRRTIGGVTRRSVEMLRWSDFLADPVEEFLYLDCASRLDNAPAFSLTFAALSGELVSAVGGVGANFAAGDVGRFIRVPYVSGKDRFKCALYSHGVAEIVARTSASTITVKIHKAMPSLAVEAGVWRLSVTRITGLDDFDGETLTVVGDGMLMGEHVVEDGAIDLPSPACIVSAGYNYTNEYESMPLDGGGQPGQGVARQQRISDVGVRVLRSVGGKITCSNGDVVPVGIDSARRAPLMPPVPFSGDRKVKLGGGSGEAPTVTLRQDQPLPFAVALLLPNVYAPWVQP